MRRVLLILLVLAAWSPPAVAAECLQLRPPVPGAVVRGFAPVGAYAGHWGADLAAPEGSIAVASAPGVVSFSGSVAGMQAVTVDHGGGLRTTVSSVAERLVATGTRVARGTPLARTGIHGDTEAVHASVRVHGVYVDPVPLWRCIAASPSEGLRLVPLP